MNEIIALKDYVVDKALTLVQAMDLQEKVTLCKKKLNAAKSDLKRTVSALKDKRISDCVSCVIPQKKEKCKSPLGAALCVAGGIMLTFIVLVILFYGLFCLLDNKKKNGYHTIKF